MRNFALGIVLLVVLSSVVLAIHTAETRYAVEQSTIEQRNIVFSENRFGQGYVKPYGGYGQKGASRGSFGAKGEEEGASTLPFSSFIPQGRNPRRISNYYASARGYQITNTYVDLQPVGLELVSRPQINGTPEGHARIIFRKPNGVGVSELTIILRALNLPPLAPEYLYEAWLADEDTGSAASIGLFQPASIGRTTTVNYHSTIPLTPFDAIMVTVEPFPDDNPLPGQVVLSAPLTGAQVRSP